MKRFNLTSLAIMAAISTGTISGAAIAGQGQPAQSETAQPAGPATTRDEAIARADRQFARMDADRNGQVTKAELDAVRQQRMARHQAKGKAMAGRGGRMAERMFLRTDTDRNGSISQAEFRATALKRFERVDSNGDGRVDAAESEAMHAKMQNRRMMRGAPSAPAGNN